MKIAIVGGSGKMGQWFTRFLQQEGHEVIITGRNEKKLLKISRQQGVKTSASLEAISSADAVLISVPIDNFESVVKELQPHISPEQVIVDITSVKVMPVEIMHRYFKKNSVLGTHPLFGPGARGIAHQNFVLTPTNKNENALAGKIKPYLEARGARVTLMTPQEHDELMAVVLGLAHFIAIVSAETLLSFNKFQQTKAISGTTYNVLLTLVESVLSEDPELYASLQMNIPKIAETEEVFLKNAANWADMIRNGNRQDFTRRMNLLKDRLENIDPDFGQAYEKMYRLLEE